MILTAGMANAPLWTLADRDQVKAAVLALAGGARAVTVSYANTGRSITYHQTDLKQLRDLLAEINREVNGAPTSRLAAFSKGFDPPRGANSGGFDPVNE